MKRLLIILILSSLWASTVAAADIDEVIVVGPSWKRFTNRDGTGLYHETLNEVFALYGITVKRMYVPSQRAYDLVRAGEADMMTCHDRSEPPLMLARHPMYEGEYHAFFSKSRIPEWKNEQSFAGKTVVFRVGYYSKENFPAPISMREVNTGESALGMVLLGRADIYIDDQSFIMESLRRNRLPFDMDKYAIVPAGSRKYWPLLLDSKRGREIRDLYDQGIERLYRSGRLQQIFSKWGFELPQYDFADNS